MFSKPVQYLLKWVLPLSLLCCVHAHASVKLKPLLTDAEIFNILKERIDVEKQGVGLVVGVIDQQGTRVISYGVMDKKTQAKVDGDTVFEIGSVTKLFTSLLLADMVQKGEVVLTDPVAKYLPQGVTMPTRNGKQISLLDLSLHKSGLPQWPDNMRSKDPLNPVADYTVAQMYEFLSRYQLTRDIGEKAEYSNIGVGLLGHVLSLRGGKDFETLVKERITNRLSMNDTGISLSARMTAHLASPHNAQGELVKNWDLPAIAGAGALRSSVNDMLKFLAANMSPDKSPLRLSIQTMHFPFEESPEIHLAWGVGKKYGTTMWNHSGSTFGYKSMLAYDETRRRGVVILSNSGEVDDIGSKILNREFRLRQYIPPASFVQALNEKGYETAIPTYDAMKKSDSDFFLREEVVNEWGYALLGQNKDAQAIEIFKLGIYVFPKSANAYDSLAEAYEKVGDKDNAILQYKKCVELEPNNPHALERLATLVKL
ncbi:MAG: class A beta-lactamase-related serine hydrolase [Undibacterium sp.]|nr:class A beta-lactamase-related serine hydrolase [Undibacterium sp.]